MNSTHVQALERQSIGHAERQQIFLERRSGDHLRAGQFFERLDFFDLESKALREITP